MTEFNEWLVWDKFRVARMLSWTLMQAAIAPLKENPEELTQHLQVLSLGEIRAIAYEDGAISQIIGKFDLMAEAAQLLQLGLSMNIIDRWEEENPDKLEVSEHPILRVGA